MEILTYFILLALALAFALFFIAPKMFGSMEDRACAVFDAFNAKAIYDRMSIAERNEIIERTAQRLISVNMKPIADTIAEESIDIMRFCYMAYALSDKGVSPIPNSEKWHLVSRPGLALMSNPDEVRKKIEHAKDVFKKRHGIEIEISYSY